MEQNKKDTLKNRANAVNNIAKGVADLIEILVGDVDAGSDGGDTFTDENGNTIQLEFDQINDEYGSISLHIQKGTTNLIITIGEPTEQLLRGEVLYDLCKTK